MSDKAATMQSVENVRTYAKWRAERRANETWVSRVNGAMPPYVRERPRDRDEARALLKRGTPERLVGPTR